MNIEEIKKRVSDFLEGNDFPDSKMVGLVRDFTDYYTGIGIKRIEFIFSIEGGENGDITGIALNGRPLVHYFGKKWGSECVELSDLTGHQLFCILVRFVDGEYEAKYYLNKIISL